MAFVPLAGEGPSIFPFGLAKIAAADPGKRDQVDDLVVNETVDRRAELASAASSP